MYRFGENYKGPAGQIPHQYPRTGSSHHKAHHWRILGVKAFQSASATLDGIETAHMIRKGQFDNNGLTAFRAV